MTRGPAWPWNRLAPWLVWAGYLALAVGTLFVWRAQGLYLVAGDEPHYLVMADGIIQDRTLEQTAPYGREFVERKIYNGLGPAGSVPTPDNSHTVLGPNGLYNIHNIALPLYLSIPFAVGRVLGAKLALIALVSLVVPLTWRALARSGATTGTRVVGTMVITYSLPFLLGANQIYPDLPAGILALVAIDRLATLVAKPRDPAEHSRPGLRSAWPRGSNTIADGLAIGCLVVLPWLQIKFSAAAVIVAAGLTVAWRSQGLSRRPIVARLSPLAATFGLLALYNTYAFGKASGPYAEGALVVDARSMAALAGLHLDRFHGLFIQIPIYAAGLLFVVSFLRRSWLLGGVVLLTCASFVVPNALHPAWYGAWSFAGRFMWSGAVVAIPCVAYGLAQAARLGRAWLIPVVASMGAGFHTWTLALVGATPLYNPISQHAFPDPSITPLPSRFAPAFLELRGAFGVAVNLAYLILAVSLIVIGWRLFPSGQIDEARVPTSRRPLKAVTGLAMAGLAGVAIAGWVDPYREQPAVWLGHELLEGDVGTIDGTARTATVSDGPGLVSFGPYMGLWADDYDYIVQTEGHLGDAKPGPVGYIEVSAWPTGRVFAIHAVTAEPGGGPSTITGRIEVPDDLHGDLLQFQAIYYGEGTMTVHQLEVWSQE